MKRKCKGGTAVETKLLEAALKGKSASITKLLKKNVDLNSKDTNDGDAAVHIAAELGHCEFIVELLRAGADRNLQVYINFLCLIKLRLFRKRQQVEKLHFILLFLLNKFCNKENDIVYQHQRKLHQQDLEELIYNSLLNLLDQKSQRRILPLGDL